jgi:hypothetical protein
MPVTLRYERCVRASRRISGSWKVIRKWRENSAMARASCWSNDSLRRAGAARDAAPLPDRRPVSQPHHERRGGD